MVSELENRGSDFCSPELTAAKVREVLDGSAFRYVLYGMFPKKFEVKQVRQEFFQARAAKQGNTTTGRGRKHTEWHRMQLRKQDKVE